MYGIIAEDNSDIACLKILIKRLANNDSLMIKHKGFKGCANMLRDGWKELKAYNELGYIVNFVVCYDKDSSKGQTRYEEVINKIIKPSGIKKDKNKICILIPTQEIEAWILADIKSISKVITSWQPEQNFPSPENIDSPKEKLIQLSRKDKPKPLYTPTRDNEKIMQYLDLDILKKKCPSFVELAQFVENDTANYPKP
jgi:hypothetical protein